MGAKVAKPDFEVARIAARQHGVVSLAQLRAAGVSRGAVRSRVGAGRLHRVHRGVYAVGHPALSHRGRWMAAVLACGQGAVLSHTNAAALWGLLRPVEGNVHVATANCSGRAKRVGIRLHRVASLTPEQCTRRYAIPVTTVARTVSDLRGVVPERLRRRAIRQAELTGFSLGSAHAGDGSRSDLEEDFLSLCRRHRVPAPEVNVRIGKWTVDFLWRGARLVVETDSYAYHRGRIAFQDDRARDLDLRSLGFDIIRISERQLNEEPATVATAIRRELARSAAS